MTEQTCLNEVVEVGLKIIKVQDLNPMTDKEKEPQWYIGMQALTREWGCLTPTEACVMAFIIERTLRFKKLKERIPQRHFLRGVYARLDDELIQSQCNVKSHAGVEAGLKGLVRKNLIDVCPNKTLGNVYKVNYDRLRLGCCFHLEKNKAFELWRKQLEI